MMIPSTKTNSIHRVMAVPEPILQPQIGAQSFRDSGSSVDD
jgi:hypothetical protein